MPVPIVASASRPAFRVRRGLSVIARAAVIIAASASLSVFAQTATIYGSIGNFDIANNTGEDACGFEIELEGVPSANNLYGWTGNRYGVPSITPYTTALASGMRIRWASNDCSTSRTTAHPPGTPFGGTCYQWYPATYATAGCEHFGVANYGGATKITSRWLVKDVANPGAYVAHDPAEAIPFPYYAVQPAVVANAAPVIIAEVQAPEPPEAPQRFGNAQWMKVFVRQLPRAVTLDELVTDNPLVVPMDPAQIEVNWTVIQADPPAGGNGTRTRSRNRGGSTLDATTRTVVRRYELYAYTGVYDPVTHEALCADLICATPGATELGDFISAQMAAVAVQGDFVTVAKLGTGGGNVNSADQRIACGSKCTSPYLAGTAVTLNAKPDSKSAFAGWTGACTGTQTSCVVNANGDVEVGATFTVAAGGGGGTVPSSFTLKVSANNSGTITSNVGGINCGLACSATVATGTAVTLTATPPAGKTFASWSGACTGTVNTCTVTVNANLSAKANFNR